METDSRSRLVDCLKELHLPTVRECFDDEADRARREALSYEEYLLEIMDRERDERRQRRIARRLRQSRLPLEKTLASFVRSRLPRKVDAQVTTLLDGSFLDRAENVLAFGNPGSGKTHLLCAIAQELIYRDRQILFAPSSLLVQELLMAKRDLRMKHALRRMAKYEAIIIDDIGYIQQNRQEMEVLFVLLAERYERASVMITSNLPFSKWERIFKDPMTTAAAIDRLVHHSVILELNLPSYRLEQSNKRKRKEVKTKQATSPGAKGPVGAKTPVRNR
jgi:DNA replication protein DnaC